MPSAAETKPTAPDPDDLAFAERLSRRRAALGWSLSRLAEASGVSKSALSKIEKAAMSPTFETLRKLAQGFGVSLAELVSDERATEGRERAPPMARQRSAATKMPSDQKKMSHQLLAAPQARLAFTPVHTTVHARTMEEHGDWDSHETLDFVYCLKGCVALEFRDHPRLVLEPGDAATVDSRPAHATLRLSEEPAELLWISGPPPDDP